MKIPPFYARWLVDIILRLSYLTQGRLIIGVCKKDFLWSSWRCDSSLGVTQVRLLAAPPWSKITNIRETRVTMADGYYFESYSSKPAD